MKRVLRAWLGIERNEERIKAVEELSLHTAKHVNAQEIRDLIAEAFTSALRGAQESDSLVGFGRWKTLAWHGNALTKLIEGEAGKTAKKIAQETTAEYIAKEQFIDEIIDRIKRKQL